MPPERRAVLLVLGLAVLGQGLRMWVGHSPGVPPGELGLIDTGGAPGSPGAHRDSSMSLARPLALGERVDLDRASAPEIARLPRVGPRLARSIVANRETHGAFGSLEGLDRVPGIGPGLLKVIGQRATFSGASRPPGSATPPDRLRLDLNAASVPELERLPFIGPYMAQQIVAYRERHGRFPAVDSLVRVPGVGPATLARIRDRVTAN